jgi:hypothetical protein
MPAELSPVEYSLTGIVTRPKEINPEAKGLAFMRRNITFAERGGVVFTSIRNRRRERLKTISI